MNLNRDARVVEKAKKQSLFTIYGTKCIKRSSWMPHPPSTQSGATLTKQSGHRFKGNITSVGWWVGRSSWRLPSHVEEVKKIIYLNNAVNTN